MGARLSPASRSRDRVSLSGPLWFERRAVLLLLLLHDRPARAAYDCRHRRFDSADGPQRARKVHTRTFYANRDVRPLLALCGHRLGLPIPIAVPHRRTLLMRLTAKPFSVGSYLGVYLALIGFTGLTTGVAFVNLGAMNTVAALAIAVAKMLLIVLFFMHARH